jgi:cell division septation protein DedD
MTDFSRDRFDGADEDRLPWLEAVEEEKDEDRIGWGKLIGAVVVGLAAIGLIIGGVFWLRERMSGPTGSGEIIAAPEGAYKEKPGDPGGMEVEGTGDVSYSASEGSDINSALDLTALPEAPVTGGVVGTTEIPASTAPKAPAPKPAAPVPAQVASATPKPLPIPSKPVAKALPAPKPTPIARSVIEYADAPVTGGGSGIQLGAFSSEAKANAAWKSLSGRFSFLAGMSPSITPIKRGSGTLYRLRVGAGADAAGICSKLKVAGESCALVN